MDRIDAAEQKAEQTKDDTRRSFLRRAATVVAGAGTGAALLAPDSTQATESNPLLIARAFHNIRLHENAHRDTLIGRLGALARPKPTFTNLARSSFIGFALSARILENTMAGAYTAAVSNFVSPFNVALFASIGATEARQASYLNTLFDLRITTNVFGHALSFEGGLSPQQIMNLLGRFFANLNGGPPLTYNGNPFAASPANDIDLLNFALALEYLEAEFYNINVPRFVG